MPKLKKSRKAAARRQALPVRGHVDARAVIASVATNCATLRGERGLSLDALARLSGLSKGMLVEIEQRRTNPSIATLCRIANALNVGLAEILHEKSPVARLVRHPAGAGKEFWRTAAGSSAVLIDAARVLNVGGELWHWALAVGESFEGTRHPQGTQEFLFVLHGALTVGVANETTRCRASESLRIRADSPHSYRNLEAAVCRFIMCVVEPISS